MRIEQRIGRVDRFGQKADKIVVANLFIQNTVDEEIYDRLYRRINLVEDGIGALEPILGNELNNLQNQLLSGDLSLKQKEEISQRIESAVASAKIQMEEFDARRRELLGDDYLSTPINPLSNRSFVSPSDAVQLSKQSLSEFEGCKYLEKGESTGTLRISNEYLNELEYYLRKPGNEIGYSELHAILFANKNIPVVFDGSMAGSLPDHVFLAPTGYWIKFLLNRLESQNRIMKIFAFSVNAQDVPIEKGNALIFIFEIKLEGLKTEIDLISVPISIDSKEYVKTHPDLMRVLSNVESQEISQIPDMIDINEYLDISRHVIEDIIMEIQNDTIEENNFKIESRKIALKNASNVRIKNFEQRIKNHIYNSKLNGELPSETYVRLTNARILKEKERVEMKINLLENQRDVSIDYSLEGILYLQMEGEQ